MNIQGKVAVITGGASGLGQATAEAIVAKGGKVMILDRDEKKGPEVAAELGENAAFVQTDVTDEASVQAAIDATKEKFGAIHVCVNCAGVGSATFRAHHQGPRRMVFEAVITASRWTQYQYQYQYSSQFSGGVSRVWSIIAFKKGRQHISSFLASFVLAFEKGDEKSSFKDGGRKRLAL